MIYLESSSYSKDTVVCFLGRQALQSQEDCVILLRNQIVGPDHQWLVLVRNPRPAPHAQFSIANGPPGWQPSHCSEANSGSLQTHLPVSCLVLVPARQWNHPPVQPAPLHDLVCKRRSRHVGGNAKLSLVLVENATRRCSALRFEVSTSLQYRIGPDPG